MRKTLGEGVYIRKGKIYTKTGNLEGNNHTMSNMPSHLSSFANQYFIRKMCVLITKGKDNKNLHDGGEDVMGELGFHCMF